MKKATCTTFTNILNSIHEMGITTRDALTANRHLYNEFGSALMDFCHFALRSNGNIRKIDELEKRSMATRADLESDCVMKIIEKLDRILHQPIEKQKNYCYTVCNHLLDDCFDLPRNKFTTVSLDSTIKGTSVDAEDAYTLLDTIGDDTYNPERMHVERETTRELKKKLKVKLAREQAEKKEAIRHELALLSRTNHPAEILVYLFAALGMKSSDITKLIIENGAIRSCEKAIMRVSSEYDIPLAEMRKYLTGNVTEKSLKLDTNDEAKVRDQVYHLRSRAKKRLDPKKHDEERHGVRS